jgi:hypothetical protein
MSFHTDSEARRYKTRMSLSPDFLPLDKRI